MATNRIALGIDIGDGESCVTMQTAERQGVEPAVIPLAGAPSFLSAVALNKQGQILIGQNAIVDDTVTEKQVRFKSRFRDDRPETNEALKRFAKGIHDQLDRCLQDSKHMPPLDSEQYIVSIGCPAGWDDATRARYTRLLKEAGFRDPVLVSESRGALMYGTCSSALGLKAQEVLQSTLIIDIGSSTLDFAWITNQKDTAVSGDTHLGGGLFDEYILKRSIDNAPNGAKLTDLIDRYPDSKAELLLETRHLKEKYFSNEDTYAKDGISTIKYIYAEGRDPVTLSINGRQMWKEIANRAIPELGGDSFVTCLDNALSQTREHTKANPPQIVLLTGGASRMGFFQDQCRAAFPGAKIILCPEPEASISKGLAYCGFEDQAANECAKAIGEYVAGDAVETKIGNGFDSLCQKLSDTLTPVVIEKAFKPSLHAWVAGNLASLNDMKTDVKRRSDVVFQSSEVERKTSDIVTEWIKPVLVDVQQDLNDICQKYGVQMPSLSGCVGTKGGGMDDAGGATKVNLTAFTAVISVIVGVIVAMICGGAGTAIIVTGPAGLVIGFIIGTAGVIAGKEKAEELMYSVKIPLFARKVMNADTFFNEKRRKAVHDEIYKSFIDNAEFKQNIITDISARIDGKVEELVQSEIQIS